MSLPKWLQIVATIGPEVLAFTPLAPIAAPVAAGIALAEQMPGKTGQQKAALVTQIALDAAQGANAQAGKVVLDPTLVQSAASAAIDTTVSVVNIVHAAHAASASGPVPVSPAVPPSAPAPAAVAVATAGA